MRFFNGKSGRLQCSYLASCFLLLLFCIYCPLKFQHPLVIGLGKKAESLIKQTIKPSIADWIQTWMEKVSEVPWKCFSTTFPTLCAVQNKSATSSGHRSRKRSTGRRGQTRTSEGGSVKAQTQTSVVQNNSLNPSLQPASDHLRIASLVIEQSSKDIGLITRSYMMLCSELLSSNPSDMGKMTKAHVLY